MKYEYSDGLRSCGRRPRLYLAKGAEFVRFEGERIEGYCCIETQRYTKNGKWSHTNFSLILSPGVRPIEMISPMHGIWGEDFPSWGDVAESLALPIEAAKVIVAEEYGETAKRLDAVEAFAMANEAIGRGTEEVVISFGSPTNRRIAEGYWTEPKVGRTADGAVVVTVVPGIDGWAKPTVVEPFGASVVSSAHTPGMHGGYYAVRVLVPR